MERNKLHHWQKSLPFPLLWAAKGKTSPGTEELSVELGSHLAGGWAAALLPFTHIGTGVSHTAFSTNGGHGSWFWFTQQLLTNYTPPPENTLYLSQTNSLKPGSAPGRRRRSPGTNPPCSRVPDFVSRSRSSGGGAGPGRGGTHGAAGRGDELPVPGGEVRQREGCGAAAGGENGEPSPTAAAGSDDSRTTRTDGRGGGGGAAPRPPPLPGNEAGEHREPPPAHSSVPPGLPPSRCPRWRRAPRLPAATCRRCPPWPRRRRPRPAPVTGPTWL